MVVVVVEVVAVVVVEEVVVVVVVIIVIVVVIVVVGSSRRSSSNSRAKAIQVLASGIGSSKRSLACVGPRYNLTSQPYIHKAEAPWRMVLEGTAHQKLRDSGTRRGDSVAMP